MLSGCTAERHWGGSNRTGEGGKIKIGLVTKTESNPYFVKLRDAARASADAHGAELIALAGKFDGDNEGQVTAIENLVRQGVSGILITPSSTGGGHDQRHVGPPHTGGPQQRRPCE
jgi:fructose transport system substrate-binding protein